MADPIALKAFKDSHDRASLLRSINGKERLTIEWDGDRTGLERCGNYTYGPFYKISDLTPSAEDILAGNPEAVLGNTFRDETFSIEFSFRQYTNCYSLYDMIRTRAGRTDLCGHFVVIALESGAMIDSRNVFPSPGIWLGTPQDIFLKSFSYEGIGGFDDSLISDRIARVAQLEAADEHMETRLSEEITALYKLISDRLGPQMMTRQLLRGTISGAYENDTVTTIRPYAFMYCYDLTSVSFPAVTIIPEYAFYYCDTLTGINFPLVETIGQWAFCRCDILASVTLPSTLKTLESYAFGYCACLTSVTFTSTPDSIAANAFNSSPNLTLISVPWSEGDVTGAPWGATNATIKYNVGG